MSGESLDTYGGRSNINVNSKGTDDKTKNDLKLHIQHSISDDRSDVRLFEIYTDDHSLTSRSADDNKDQHYSHPIISLSNDISDELPHHGHSDDNDVSITAISPSFENLWSFSKDTEHKWYTNSNDSSDIDPTKATTSGNSFSSNGRISLLQNSDLFSFSNDLMNEWFPNGDFTESSTEMPSSTRKNSINNAEISLSNDLPDKRYDLSNDLPSSHPTENPSEWHLRSSSVSSPTKEYLSFSNDRPEEWLHLRKKSNANFKTSPPPQHDFMTEQRYNDDNNNKNNNIFIERSSSSSSSSPPPNNPPNNTNVHHHRRRLRNRTSAPAATTTVVSQNNPWSTTTTMMMGYPSRRRLRRRRRLRNRDNNGYYYNENEAKGNSNDDHHHHHAKDAFVSFILKKNERRNGKGFISKSAFTATTIIERNLLSDDRRATTPSWIYDGIERMRPPPLPPSSWWCEEEQCDFSTWLLLIVGVSMLLCLSSIIIWRRQKAKTRFNADK